MNVPSGRVWGPSQGFLSPNKGVSSPLRVAKRGLGHADVQRSLLAAHPCSLSPPSLCWVQLRPLCATKCKSEKHSTKRGHVAGAESE